MLLQKHSLCLVLEFRCQGNCKEGEREVNLTLQSLYCSVGPMLRDSHHQGHPSSQNSQGFSTVYVKGNSILGLDGSFEFVTTILTDTSCSKVLKLHSSLQTQQGMKLGAWRTGCDSEPVFVSTCMGLQSSAFHPTSFCKVHFVSFILRNTKLNVKARLATGWRDPCAHLTPGFPRCCFLLTQHFKEVSWSTLSWRHWETGSQHLLNT